MGNRRVRLALLLAAFAITFVAAQAAANHRLLQRRLPDWSSIPYQLGEWSGTDGQFDPLYGSDPADTRLLRLYRQGTNPPVIAYVGFFSDLATILEVHTPELCYPAQGWTIVSSTKPMTGTFRGTRIPATQIVTDKNGDRRLVVWWYNAGPRPFETRIRYVYKMLAMSTITGRTDGSMVRLEIPVVRGGEAKAGAKIEEFENVFLPELDKALPR